MFDGLRRLGPIYTGIRACAIVSCATNNPSSCTDTKLHLKPTPIASIEISSTVLTSDAFYFPTTLQTSLTPLSSYAYCSEEINGEEAKIQMEAISERHLLTFGFYGRVYGRDYYSRSNVGMSGDDWMKIYMAAAAVVTAASVLFIFYAQKTDLKLKIT